MSTHCVFTTQGPHWSGEGLEQYHVFAHSDGYPKGAAAYLKATLQFAWKLPRFEPDEFAASICCGIKWQTAKWCEAPFPDPQRGGYARIVDSPRDVGDCEFWYLLSMQTFPPVKQEPANPNQPSLGPNIIRPQQSQICMRYPALHIEAYQTHYWRDDRISEKLFWDGTLDNFFREFLEATP